MKQTTDFLKMKQNNEKIVMLTAYDYPSAKHAEQAGVDMILVGDSLGMVVLGYESTIPVTVDDMIHHTKAVKRGAKQTYIVTDMPFMSYHISKEVTQTNAARIIQEGGAHAVKVEGADQILGVISDLTNAGVPVVSHLGLTPQAVGVLGGYKVQGKDAEGARKLLEDAKKCEEAGAIALVIECVPRQLAAIINEHVNIPVIGIGAGNKTDGQVLVYHDVISYGVDRVPKFVKQFTSVDTQIQDGLKKYVASVKTNSFPAEEHTFTMKDSEIVALYGGNTK